MERPAHVWSWAGLSRHGAHWLGSAPDRPRASCLVDLCRRCRGQVMLDGTGCSRAACPSCLSPWLLAAVPSRFPVGSLSVPQSLLEACDSAASGPLLRFSFVLVKTWKLPSVRSRRVRGTLAAFLRHTRYEHCCADRVFFAPHFPAPRRLRARGSAPSSSRASMMSLTRERKCTPLFASSALSRSTMV